MDNLFIIILNLFSPEPIFGQLDGLIKIYAINIVPAVILLSIATRYLELQVENLGQGANLSEAIKDVKIAIIFTALYAGLGVMVINLHQAFCAYMYSNGSIKELMSGYQNFIQKLDGIESDDYMTKLSNAASKYTLEAMLTKAMYYLSMVLLSLVNAILRIVYAIGFCLLYVWGMVAVPTMATKMFKVTSGWWRGVMALLIWPILEASMYMLTNPIFAGLADKITSSQVEQLSFKMASVSLIYTFANILLMSIGVAAFAVAVFVSMNQNLLGGLGSSMMTAFTAGTSLVMNATKLVKTSVGGMQKATSGLGAAGGPASNMNSTNSGVDSLYNHPDEAINGAESPAMAQPSIDHSAASTSSSSVEQGANASSHSDPIDKTPSHTGNNEHSDQSITSKGDVQDHYVGKPNQNTAPEASGQQNLGLNKLKA